MNGANQNPFKHSSIDRILPTEDQVDELLKDITVIEKTADIIIESNDLEKK